MKPYKQL